VAVPIAILDEQVEVVIVAVKAQYLEAVNTAVEESGLRADEIGIATMGLHNAVRYNYGNMPSCSYIGARTIKVLFIEPAKVFSRSVPISGSTRGSGQQG
jgi:type IV pilus assembly protein PilM